MLVGPGTSRHDEVIPIFRSMGFHSGPSRSFVPLLHAKLVLLGTLTEVDEHPAGGVVDDLLFLPDRLWTGSANLTNASRQSLEFGHWTQDPALLREAQRFLAALVADSEPVESLKEASTPELLEPDYDDEAFAEYAAEYPNE